MITEKMVLAVMDEMDAKKAMEIALKELAEGNEKIRRILDGEDE